jgi:ABC-type multidrug transport system permease subunit
MAKLTARVAMIIGGLCLLAFLAVIGLVTGPIKLAWAVVWYLCGVATLAIAAATSSDLRAWFASVDDQIDDEGMARTLRRKAGVK